MPESLGRIPGLLGFCPPNPLEAFLGTGAAHGTVKPSLLPADAGPPRKQVVFGCILCRCQMEIREDLEERGFDDTGRMHACRPWIMICSGQSATYARCTIADSRKRKGAAHKSHTCQAPKPGDVGRHCRKLLCKSHRQPAFIHLGLSTFKAASQSLEGSFIVFYCC